MVTIAAEQFLESLKKMFLRFGHDPLDVFECTKSKQRRNFVLDSRVSVGSLSKRDMSICLIYNLQLLFAISGKAVFVCIPNSMT